MRTHRWVPMPWVTAGEARAKRSGRLLVVTVDPRSIAGFVDIERPVTRPLEMRVERLPLPDAVTSRVAKVIGMAHPAVIGVKALPQAVRVERTRTYRWMQDLLSHRTDHRESLLYRELREKLEANGFARRKGVFFTSVAELDEHFTRVLLPMITTMESDGYVDELASDVAEVTLDADGRLQKSAHGNHRFAVARELGVKAFPVRIVYIDRAWLRSTDGGLRIPARIDRLTMHLEEVASRHR